MSFSFLSSPSNGSAVTRPGASDAACLLSPSILPTPPPPSSALFLTMQQSATAKAKRERKERGSPQVSKKEGKQAASGKGAAGARSCRPASSRFELREPGLRSLLGLVWFSLFVGWLVCAVPTGAASVRGSSCFAFNRRGNRKLSRSPAAGVPCPCFSFSFFSLSGSFGNTVYAYLWNSMGLRLYGTGVGCAAHPLLPFIMKVRLPFCACTPRFCSLSCLTRHASR